MNEVRKKIKDLKETLKNDMKSLNLDKGIFGSLGFGGIAIIIVNYLTGLALFNTIGGLGFFATLGAFGISKFASAYRKASKLKKYEQHLDNINARVVKADKKSNDKRHAAIKNHEKSLVDKKKITGFLDKILSVSMGLSLGWMLLLRTSPLALLMPIVATASAILKIKPSIDEADLEARIKCIQSDLDVAKIKSAATPASQGASQKVLTQGTNTATTSKTYNSGNGNTSANTKTPTPSTTPASTTYQNPEPISTPRPATYTERPKVYRKL